MAALVSWLHWKPLGRRQTEAKITFPPFTCVSLNDEYWFDSLCSTTCAPSVINSLWAIRAILPSYPLVTSRKGQQWMGTANNWDNCSWEKKKKQQHHASCCLGVRPSEISFHCSTHRTISYDLLIGPACNAIAFYCFTFTRANKTPWQSPRRVRWTMWRR